MTHVRKYSKELLDRGTRLVFESGRPVAHVAKDLGIESETLRKYVRQTEADEGRRKDVPSSQERDEIKALRREVAQLRRANEMAVSTGGRNGSCEMTQEPIPEVVDAWALERRAEAARFQTTSEWLAADGSPERSSVRHPWSG
jgi:transposase